MSHLRGYLDRHLAPEGAAGGTPWIAADRNTVAWRPAGPCEVDVDAFALTCRRLLAIDPALVEPGDLESALALHSGPLLRDVSDAWATVFREHLTAEYDRLRAWRVLVWMAHGDPDRAADAAERRVADDPFQEAAYRLVMEVHYARGDRTAAMDWYAACQRMLEDEFDAAPQPETEALVDAIRRGRPVDWPLGRIESFEARTSLAAAATNSLSTTSPGSIPSATSPTPSLDPPVATPPLIDGGRVDAALACLRTTQWLTITGPPGAGKTRIGMAVAARLIAEADRPNPRIAWLDLDPDGDAIVATDVVPAITQRLAAWLGVAPDLGSIAEALHDRAAVVVLDHTEHALARIAAWGTAILRRAPAARLVVISRERMQLAGEVAWEVPLLGLPATDEWPPRTPLPESTALLLGRVDARASGPPPEPEWIAAVAVCRTLDGLPLAIEHAAIAATTVHPGLSRSRYSTVARAIEASLARLAPEERALLERLAVFAGPFSTIEAEIVCAGGADREVRISGPAVLDLVDTLVNHSLVLTDVNAATARHRLLGVVRAHGLARLRAAGTLADWQARRDAVLDPTLDPGVPSIVEAAGC